MRRNITWTALGCTIAILLALTGITFLIKGSIELTRIRPSPGSVIPLPRPSCTSIPSPGWITFYLNGKQDGAVIRYRKAETCSSPSGAYYDDGVIWSKLPVVILVTWAGKVQAHPLPENEYYLITRKGST